MACATRVLSRISRWRDGPPDRRSLGSMAQFAREFLSLNPTGWTRGELRDVLRAKPQFYAQFQRNPGAFPNMVWRLIERGEIEERDGQLFASERTRLSVVVRKELFELDWKGFRSES